MTPENKSIPSVMSDKSDPSVNTLESLVPPLDLCEQIPPGAFENSALTWNEGYVKGNYLIERRGFGRHYIAPAPTLPEILVTMKHLSISLGFSIHPLDWRWYIYVNDQKSNDGTRIKEDHHDNPTTAALKLWLEINPSEVKS